MQNYVTDLTVSPRWRIWSTTEGVECSRPLGVQKSRTLLDFGAAAEVAIVLYLIISTVLAISCEVCQIEREASVGHVTTPGVHISYLVLAPNWVSDCTTSIVCTTIPYRRQSIRVVRMESRVQGFHKLPDHLDRFGLDWNSNTYYTFIKPIIIFCIVSRGRKMFLLLFKRLLRRL